MCRVVSCRHAHRLNPEPVSCGPPTGSRQAHDGLDPAVDEAQVGIEPPTIVDEADVEDEGGVWEVMGVGSFDLDGAARACPARACRAQDRVRQGTTGGSGTGA